MKEKLKLFYQKENSLQRLINVAKFFGTFMFLIMGVILFLSPLPIYSSDVNKEEPEHVISDVENELIISKTEEYYNKGEYLKAVDQINIGIELYQQVSKVPDNIVMLGEASYYSWINSIYKKSGVLPMRLYNKVILYLTLHPEIMSQRITSLVQKIYEGEKSLLENDRIIAIEKNDRIKLNKIQKQIYVLEQNKNDLENVVHGNKTVKEFKRALEVEQDYKKAQIVKILIIVLYILIFLSILILLIVIKHNHKKTIMAQEQFETTMKVVSILNYTPSSSESPYSVLNSGEQVKTSKDKNRSKRKTGLSDFESEEIAVSYFDDEDAKKKFLKLQNQCIDLGEKVDKVTERKRNSKKVSELVFKLCKASGVDDELALIYYCASMVYDAGFLSVSKSILQGEHLTIKERYEVRSHVQKAGEYFDFIPENIRRIFLDAAEFHHENFDGKGYVSGLSGNKIPLIARFIRVSESYISLINSRSYKKIMDTDSALNELKKNAGIYDPKILALLEKVV